MIKSTRRGFLAGTAPLTSGITSLPKEEEQLLVNVTLTRKT